MLATVLLSGLSAGAQQVGRDIRESAAAVASLYTRYASACTEPSIDFAPERGGRTRITIDTPCRAQQFVVFTYAGAVFIKSLDLSGRADFILDCFAGDGEPVAIVFEDDTRVVRRPVVADLRDFSKVAIVWASAVDLDLHAFEYAAPFGGPGHVWSGHPGSMEEATADAQREGRGHGFLSTIGAGGETGMNFEVYTFVHQRGQTAGSVKLAVDYSTRGHHPQGMFCGKGHLAEQRFQAYVLERGNLSRKLDLTFAAVPCGAEIGAGAQFNARLIPDLVIRG